MGMRISFGLVCAGATTLLSACGSVDEPSLGEQVAEVEQKNVVQQPQASDSLAVYAARCDAATGIHVPAFSCNSGIATPSGTHHAFIDQKSSIDNVTQHGALDSVGLGTGGALIPPDVAVTAKQMNAAGGTFGSQSDSFRFAHVGNAASAGATEVKIVGYAGAATGALAGLMIRSDDPAVDGDSPLEANAPHVMLSIDPGGTVRLRYRATKNGSTSEVASLTGKTFPIWLRLSWEGDLGTKAEISSTHDPNSWTVVGTAPLSPPVVETGVAVANATVNYDRFYTTRFCDSPSGLGGSCDLKSTFQVLARTADAIAVANCRSEGNIRPGFFSDIAVIQYNRKNGALCFYQSDLLDDDAEDGTAVNAPSDPNGTFEWLSPTDTHGGTCTGCHDTGGLIRSPYLKQTGLLPDWMRGFDNDGNNPLRYVGHDYQNDRSYRITAPNFENTMTGEVDTGSSCTSCHRMAVNNVRPSGGTSMMLGIEATSEFQLPTSSGIPHKNPASATSPLWMRPSYDSVLQKYVYPTAYNELAERTATNFKACGQSLQDQNSTKAPGEEWDLTSTQPEAPNGAPGQTITCNFGPQGSPYGSPIQILQDVQWGGGGSSSGTTLDNVTVTSAAGTDIYNNSDTGVLAYTLVAPGDGSAVVKVTSLKDTAEYAKAGVMFRGDTAANAANVMVAYTAHRGVSFQYRPSAGAATPLPVFLPNITTLPVWLRLDRSGETFVGYVSTDNRASWQQIAPAVTLPGFNGSLVGLVNTAHTLATQTGEAKFEAFDFTHGYGWAGSTDPHLLTDVRVGSGATGSRHEWITREYVHAGGNNGGGDIQNNADKFFYAFRTFQGNGELLTTVESLTSTAAWGKAGLMVRDSIAEGAKNVFVGKTPSGVTFQYRDATGQGTTVNNVNTANQATDLRIVRSGATGLTFTAYYKTPSSSSWIWIGAHTFTSFNAKAITGLAVSTQTSGATTDAVFNSRRYIEPPGFLWPDLQPEEIPVTPPPTGRPCDALCAPATTFTWSGNNYQSGPLGTGAICMETTHALAGGNCSNVQSPRTFQVNGVTQTCNGVNWSSLPAARNGGYCVALPAGQRPDAAFALW